MTILVLLPLIFSLTLKKINNFFSKEITPPPLHVHKFHSFSWFPTHVHFMLVDNMFTSSYYFAHSVLVSDL